MNRRGFFKFLGAAPVALVAPAAQPESPLDLARDRLILGSPAPFVTGTVISAAEMNHRFDALWNTVGSIAHQLRNGYRR